MENETIFTFGKLIIKNQHFTKDENDDSRSIYILQENSCDAQFSDFECAGDEVLVESSPPASPAQMAARLAAPAQSATSAPSPGGTVRELIVIPELPNSMHLQHAMQQVTSSVVEVNGDSSGHSSPSTEPQHTYITVASEGSNGVNYHVQYVESQDLYAQGPQTHMESLRSYPVYGVTSVPEGAASGWSGATELAAYGVVVAGEAPPSPAAAAPPPPPPPRMPPATVQWLLDNYETADGVSLPRSTLYTHYLRHCNTHRLDPVNAASFGKLIRSVFIGLRTRRLGTRGNSKYHYYGIRAKPNAADSPPRHDSEEDKSDLTPEQEGRDPTEQVGGPNLAHRQYLGKVTAPDPPELTLLELPDDVPADALEILRRHHREHGAAFLSGVAALDTGAVERARRQFWRRPPPALCRRTLPRLLALQEVTDWLSRAELALHQKAVELLMPDVLRPIPAHLTQSIRNFAKTLEGALWSAAAAAPRTGARAQAGAAGALAAALRRYTSLNHLAQAARAVLTNQHQIQQMLADLNRVDFRVVREQAAWACSCANAAAANKLEADFKATLGRGATLEQWAVWLEKCVTSSLSAYEHKPEYSARARRLLLDWSFYSSLVIRELTLRSAASFGSFHLIRLLFDEYVAYLIERRVAAHEEIPTISVMHRPQDIPTEDDEEMDENGEAEGDMGEGGEAGEGGEGGPSRLEPDEDDPDWDWEDEDEDEDEMEAVVCKKQKM